MKAPFEDQKADRDQSDRIRRVYAACNDLYDCLFVQCPEGRHRAVAVTNLEQVAMWAAKAIALEEPA